MNLIDERVPTEGTLWTVNRAENTDQGMGRYNALWCPAGAQWYTTEVDAWDAVREAVQAALPGTEFIIQQWEDGARQGLPVIIWTGWADALARVDNAQP